MEVYNHSYHQLPVYFSAIFRVCNLIYNDGKGLRVVVNDGAAVSQGFKVDELLKELLGLDFFDSWMSRPGFVSING